MAERPDKLAAALRFLAGAAVGAFAAFWLALASESAGRHFGAVVAVASVAGGILAQVPNVTARDLLDRGAPYVMAAVALAVILFLSNEALELRTARERCRRCCQAAGFPSMIYAADARLLPRYCICSDREDPDHPRTDRGICSAAGRQARWSR